MYWYVLFIAQNGKMDARGPFDTEADASDMGTDKAWAMGLKYDPIIFESPYDSKWVAVRAWLNDLRGGRST